MIAIVDYGRGNLGSVEKAFARIGMPAVVTQDPKVVDDAEAVVLPGDGAFHDAMDNLEARGLIAPVRGCLEQRHAGSDHVDLALDAEAALQALDPLEIGRAHV